MRTMTLPEFHAALRAQGVSGREHAAVKCPVCSTVQSIATLIAAGCPPEKADTQIGFSCQGRWNKAGPATREGRPQDPENRPGCDWTLGGLFRIHRVEVVVDGKAHPTFEPATAEEAQALEKAGR